MTRDVAVDASNSAEIWWLRGAGPGSHGEERQTPTQVVESLRGKFSFDCGLREPQLGALHAVLAYESTWSAAPGTVVMPTGTGKTETMLAIFAHSPKLTLVVVPSDALRRQIAEKFVTLGVLHEVGAIKSDDFTCPVVGVLKGGMQTREDVEKLAEKVNVVIATPQAFAACKPEAQDRLGQLCQQVIFDEAHHVAARSWRDIAGHFTSKSSLQFTATPFREDGQNLGGSLIYSYPLRLAQERGWFSKIVYSAVLELGDKDYALAFAAVARLRQDLENGLDHVLMARASSISRAKEILSVYEELAPDLGPIRIDSRLSETDQRQRVKLLWERSARIVVCVDMLGEGFDLPALKIAAIHDPHLSLSVTLQFIGRFARRGEEASIFVSRVAGSLDDRLRRLYGEDSDWNVVVREVTEGAVDKQRERSDFQQGFGALPSEVAMESIRPKMSTVVYKTSGKAWNPEGVYAQFGEDRLLTSQLAINRAAGVCWFITREMVRVVWGEAQLAEYSHHLYVLHYDSSRGLLYINSSDNSSTHKELAQAVCGETAEIVSGDIVYRLLHGIERRIPTNIGLLDAVSRTRRFSMHVGADVMEGFKGEAGRKSKTNIFAHGFRDGSRVALGASRKGRVWSYSVARDIYDWVSWVRGVGPVLLDSSISIADVMNGFVIPLLVTERPRLTPLAIEWSPKVIASTRSVRQIALAGKPASVLDVELRLTSWDLDGPIRFAVTSGLWDVEYTVDFTEEGPIYSAIDEDMDLISRNGVEPLSSFMNRLGMAISFEKEAYLTPDGYLIAPERTVSPFDGERLEVIDWSKVNIRKESQGKERDSDSIQARAIEVIEKETEWDLIVDDDGAGEVADVVFVRREGREIHLALVHCKFSSSDIPGARLGDMYEVCGQAVKNHKAKAEIDFIFEKLMRREEQRRKRGVVGLIKGSDADLVRMSHEVRELDPTVTIVIVQPGLSARQMNRPIAELLASVDSYLMSSYAAKLRVICSA